MQPIFINFRLSQNHSIGNQSNILVLYDYENSRRSPLLVIFHHDFTSPIQYDLSVPEVYSQADNCVLFQGCPVLAKTANDPPRDKQSLLALYHDSRWSNFL